MAARRGFGWAYIDLAAFGDNGWRRYALALTLIIVIPSITATILAFSAGAGPAGAVLQQYAPIVAAGMVVIWATTNVHRRPWRSLMSSELVVDPRRLLIGALVQAAIMGGQLALADALTGWRLDLSLALSWPTVVVALLLIPLQAASEELLFRGYATQALGRVIGSRVIIALLVALLFGALHLDTHGGLTVPYFLVLSLVFSLVSLRDEGLELTIGGHAAMNLFAFGTAHTSLMAMGAIGDAPAAAPFTAAAIVAIAADGALFYGFTRLGVRLVCRPRLAAPDLGGVNEPGSTERGESRADQ